MTIDQKIFIAEQGIPQELFIDAKGRPVNQIEEQMKTLGKVFVYNTTPCESYGHTMRTRAGHCIQCSTASIAFILRAISFGSVYVAGSIKGELIKIGTTSSKESRADTLNSSKYGNVDDWEILLSFKCLNAGTFEKEVHGLLRPYSAVVKYNHDNHNQQTLELFRCSYGKAKETVFHAKAKLKAELIQLVEKNNRTYLYNFRTLRRSTTNEGS